MFKDKTAPFPDEVLKLGCYLGPSIDIGPAITMFVDNDRAGDKVFCRSRSSFLIYINTALVQWFSKKQTAFETSVFGAEFVALKQDIDTLWGLR